MKTFNRLESYIFGAVLGLSFGTTTMAIQSAYDIKDWGYLIFFSFGGVFVLAYFIYCLWVLKNTPER